MLDKKYNELPAADATVSNREQDTLCIGTVIKFMATLIEVFFNKSKNIYVFVDGATTLNKINE